MENPNKSKSKAKRKNKNKKANFFKSLRLQIAADELSQPNTTASWAFLNCVFFGMRKARQWLCATRRGENVERYYFELPQGLVLENNPQLCCIKAGDCKVSIPKPAINKAIEQLESPKAVRIFEHKVAHCLFVILDKFRLVGKAGGGEFELRTAELVVLGIVSKDKSAKALFLALQTLLSSVVINNHKLFNSIKVEHGKMVFSTCRGATFIVFCGNHFVGIKRDALRVLSQRELLAMRYVLGVKAFAKGSGASFNTLIKFAGFSLCATKHGHEKRFLDGINKALAKIQKFLGFELKIERGLQTLKSYVERGTLGFISKPARPRIVDAQLSDAELDAQLSDAQIATALKRYKTQLSGVFSTLKRVLNLNTDESVERVLSWAFGKRLEKIKYAAPDLAFLGDK